MISILYSKLRRITSNQLYFPEIDGIRFLAILLVVLFHIHGYFISPEKNPLNFSENSYNNALNTFLSNGDRGVELFFVLSGFILCMPFAHYYINHGKKVGLKKYYLRRVTRLEPPYLIAITALFIMQLAMKLHPVSELVPHWLASLGYAHNFIYHQVPMLTVVAWSLEIEIQFYILAPIFFSVLALNKSIRRTLIVVAITALIFCQYFYPPSFISLYGYAQYFFMGILLADLYVSDSAPQFFTQGWIPTLALVLFAALMYLPAKNNELPASVLIPSRLLLPLLIGLIYMAILKNGFLKKIFSYRFIPVIGGMCYSIYLLHYTIISFVGRYTIGFTITKSYLPNLIFQTIILCIPILILSSVYYYFIERPFMSKKWLDMLMKKNKKMEEINKIR